LIEEIVRNVPIPVQVGGGIRDQETIDHYLSAGVKWVILGTVPSESHRSKLVTDFRAGSFWLLTRRGEAWRFRVGRKPSPWPPMISSGGSRG
jgi:hypothetical protein